MFNINSTIRYIFNLLLCFCLKPYQHKITFVKCCFSHKFEILVQIKLCVYLYILHRDTFLQIMIMLKLPFQTLFYRYIKCSRQLNRRKEEKNVKLIIGVNFSLYIFKTLFFPIFPLFVKV